VGVLWGFTKGRRLRSLCSAHGNFMFMSYKTLEREGVGEVLRESK
jgi:hypothetical protein